MREDYPVSCRMLVIMSSSQGLMTPTSDEAMTQRKEISQLIIKTGYVTHVTVKINDYIKLSGLQF